MNIEERRDILQREISRYSQAGFRVVSQTDTTVQLVKPKEFSCLWASLWFLLLGIGLLFYLFYYWSKHDEVVYLEVDANGQVHRR